MQQRCYFHKSQYIEHFCALKQCTLPLCEQCLQIHHEEHNVKCEKASIIPYRQAYQQVFGNLSTFIQSNKKPLQSLSEQIKKDKQQAILAIENHYKNIESKIEQKSKQLTQIEQKFEKLKKGSIKTVIYYYSGEIVLKQLEIPVFKEISSSLKSFLNNVNDEKKEQIQTFRQRRVSQPQWSESKIQPYEPKQQTHSKKKSIFQNDKSKLIQHKNNEPYLQNNINSKEQMQPKYSYENYQRQKTIPQEQKSVVDNYFPNYRVDSSHKLETNTYKGQLNNFKVESKNLRNFQIESHLGIQTADNNRVLKETPYALNQQYKEIRSRTLDKFPSMVDLKKGRQNTLLLHNEEDLTKQDKTSFQNKPGKWNKIKQDEQSIRKFERQPSTFSQATINEASSGINPLNTQFNNRRPLKTTDLDTYMPSNNIQPSFEGQERAASYEVGLRTTVSHNNLHAAKKMEPLLGDDLKKQVLSPHEIRRMLEKKIEERNKVLTQKKEHQLKLNTDRTTSNLNNGTGQGIGNLGTQNNYYKQNVQTKQAPLRYDQNQNINTNWAGSEQRASMYNTKDSIINQIYRQTRY